MTRTPFIGIANELDADGWCRVAPYGESIKHVAHRSASGAQVVQTYIQLLNREGATALANSFNGIRGKLKRFWSTVPLFDGHPDLARVVPDQADGDKAEEIPVGTINKLEARDDGLYVQVGLFPSGQALANEGRKFISPFWWADIAERRGDAIVVRPSQLISGGLTDRPNIQGGQPLANSQQKTQEDSMRQLIIGLLAARGIAIANEASESDILAKTAGVITTLEGTVSTITTERNALANEKATLTTERTSLIAERDGLKTNLQTASTRETDLRTALANQRTEHARTLVDLALAQGRISVAEKETKLAMLTSCATPEAFTAAAQALANEAVKHPVQRADLGNRRQESNQTPREQLVALENQAPYKDIRDYNDRFNAILRDNPSLKEALSPKPTT